MKRKLNYKNIAIAIIFLISSGYFVIGGIWLAWSTRCLTYKGTILTIIMITIAGLTGGYLEDKMQ